MTAALAVQGLGVAYAGLQAVAASTLCLEPGELAGLVGANGAGKSSLVNAIAGWSRGRPSVTGQVMLDGEDVSALPAHERARRGLVLMPEGHGAFMRLTVEENLRAVLPARAGGRPFPIAYIYTLFPRLAERRANVAASLSGGERQMLALGRALRMAPRVLLMDEPSIGLAPRLVSTLLQTVRALADGGLTVLLVEQNVRAASAVVDTLHLLERGRLLASGPIDAMRDDRRILDAYLGAAHA